MFFPTLSDELIDFGLLPLSLVASAASLEEAGYPADEKASLGSLEYRQKEAPDYFMGAKVGAELAGFICGTRCEEFVEETMSTHSPSGPILAIHSVCVAEEYRRKKVATSMLRQYVNDVAFSPTSSTITTIALIAKQHLLSFYVSCGFTVIGLSEIVHGKDPWFHLTLSLTDYRKSKFYVVDAFTSTPGCGNPAAVVLAPPNATDEAMQTIAKEFNLSETVFITRAPAGAPGYSLAYFTPTTEINLCGHATLAAASVLFAHPSVDSPTLDFDVLRSGLGISAESIISINYVGPSGQASPEDILVEVTPSSFSSLGPVDLQALKATAAYHHGLIVCCEGDASGASGAQFSSRFFAPKIGIDEDPVCGRAHTILCPYFSKKLGLPALDGFQNSERGGVIKCKWEGGRVYMRGERVIVSSGQLEGISL
ncbi:hypothetical protein TrRE_jg5085 [Triparma retinervis]|uniref:N-acetyltransferase domain-containing protein n=1 Tax=Triparma retinervis TaxID=2557542 RepID=A0A9W7F668_9STRA|nr:hypothetical protein TrRE_jg5085 [Triparma retinervis]